MGSLCMVFFFLAIPTTVSHWTDVLLATGRDIVTCRPMCCLSQAEISSLPTDLLLAKGWDFVALSTDVCLPQAEVSQCVFATGRVLSHCRPMCYLPQAEISLYYRLMCFCRRPRCCHIMNWIFRRISKVFDHVGHKKDDFIAEASYSFFLSWFVFGWPSLWHQHLFGTRFLLLFMTNSASWTARSTIFLSCWTSFWIIYAVNHLAWTEFAVSYFQVFVIFTNNT